MRLKKALFFMTVLSCLCAVLFGCQTEQPEQTTLPTETTIPQYTVTYRVFGETYRTQTVEKGKTADAVIPALEGLKFYGWRNAEGELIRPTDIIVREDMVFDGELFADLSAHEPYLFADSNGFLRPQDPLTVEELTVAINVLAMPGSDAYIPAMPEGTGLLEVSELGRILEALFPREKAEMVMSLLDGPNITRADFAALMNNLLERDLETALAAEGAKRPVDLDITREDLPALCEAHFHHDHVDGEDRAWSDILATMGKYPQGFFNREGWLYYVDESGVLVTDAQVGELSFDANGRYTCGDAELDAMVAEILAQIISDNPGAERIDLLRRAFEYSRDSFSYLRRSAYYFGQTGWEIEDAKKMLTTKRGNCYSYAAVFWALGRGLGYETIAISGTMTGTDQPHSWVEIYFDGEPFVFDPEMEMVYRFERDIFDKDMFMVDYEKGKYWNYKRP